MKLDVVTDDKLCEIRCAKGTGVELMTMAVLVCDHLAELISENLCVEKATVLSMIATALCKAPNVAIMEAAHESK